ncbi:hypothetical protein P7K49_038714, partial [Saguinus oedipus]
MCTAAAGPKREAAREALGALSICPAALPPRRGEAPATAARASGYSPQAAAAEDREEGWARASEGTTSHSEASSRCQPPSSAAQTGLRGTESVATDRGDTRGGQNS